MHHFHQLLVAEGNIEFLFHLTADEVPTKTYNDDTFDALIDDAYKEL